MAAPTCGTIGPAQVDCSVTTIATLKPILGTLQTQALTVGSALNAAKQRQQAAAANVAQDQAQLTSARASTPPDQNQIAQAQYALGQDQAQAAQANALVATLSANLAQIASKVDDIRARSASSLQALISAQASLQSNTLAIWQNMTTASKAQLLARIQSAIAQAKTLLAQATASGSQ